VWAREAAHGLCRRLEQYIVEDAAVQCAVLYAATVQLFGGQGAADEGKIASQSN